MKGEGLIRLDTRWSLVALVLVLRHRRNPRSAHVFTQNSKLAGRDSDVVYVQCCSLLMWDTAASMHFTKGSREFDYRRPGHEQFSQPRRYWRTREHLIKRLNALALHPILVVEKITLMLVCNVLLETSIWKVLYHRCLDAQNSSSCVVVRCRYVGALHREDVTHGSAQGCVFTLHPLRVQC